MHILHTYVTVVNKRNMLKCKYIQFQNILVTNIQNIVNIIEDDPKLIITLRHRFCIKA